MSEPIAIVELEDAFLAWLSDAVGITPHIAEKRDDQAPLPDKPQAQVSWFGLLPIAQAEMVKIPSVMIQRYTVIQAGAGTVGVDFAVGLSISPTEISTLAGAGNTIDDSAVDLLAELTADLPAGIIAELDPEDTASVLVTGSLASPLFSAGPTDPAFVTVTTLCERYPELEATYSSMTWRVSFTSEDVRGTASAGGYLAKAMSLIQRKLAPAVKPHGWSKLSVLLDEWSIADDRSESTATLDILMLGYSTAVFNEPAARAIGTAHA